ncbi:MAG TPA: DUF3426 domain-containing protein [Desulfuromonadaceae bacterium]
MIIQCEQCNTKFRLDDSKVTDKGVKVRCAKCRNVFTVRKESVEPEAQPDLDAMFTQPPSDFGALLDRSATFDAGEPPATPAPQAPAAATAAPEPGFDYSDFVSSDFDQEAGGGTPGFEPPGDEAAPVSAPGGADFGFPLPEGEQGFEPEHGETRAPGGEVDFGGFDFGGGTADAGTAVGAAPAEFDFRDLRMDQPSAETPAGGAADAGPFDFGDLALEPSQEPVSAPGTGEAAPFGFGGGAAFGEVPPAPPVEEAAEPGAGESLDLGEVGFGAGQAARPAAQEAPPEPESLQTPARQPAEPREEQPEAEAGEEPGEGSTMEVPQAGMEELPPLSITSRRRQSPLFGVLIAVVAVVAVAVLGFFGYTMFLEDKGKVVTEAGRITVRGVNASFVKNPVVGELLVITGEAVNTFAKPRAAIQIRGMVYGAGGQILASKNAYCGNPLTKEQLSTLPLDKIEAAMANQFGDSLANMEVAPGKAIPFVIVIPKPPAEGKDYGVEPAGSTVATGKLQ